MTLSRIGMMVLALSGLAVNAPVEAQDFVARSAACVAHLRKLDPGTHIRAGLTESSCPLDKEAVAYTAKARLAWLESGAACRTTPAPEMTQCGLETELTDTLDHGLVRIDIGGGRCLHVAPVILTDKPDGFACNAVKARSACLLGVRHDAGRTVVTLGSGRGSSAAKAEIVIPGTPDRSRPLAAPSRAGPLFALLPSAFTYKGEQLDTLGNVRLQTESLLARCTGTQRHCREQAGFVADLHLQQVLRRVWNPRALMSPQDQKLEREAFLAAVAAADLGAHAADKRLFARIITRNEIGGESPNQVLDAVIRNSSLSWGAHQIDVGANPQPEIDLFWATLRAWRRAPGTGDYPHLRTADTYRACLSQPLRAYFVAQLALAWTAMPDMTKGLRAPQSQAAYRRHFVKWLDDELKPVMGFDGLFKVSAFARHYYLDQTNQRGTKARNLLRDTGRSIPASELQTCADVELAEGKLVQAIKCAYLTGDCTQPPADLSDIDRRVDNLRRMLTEELGPSLGRVCRQ